MLVPKGHNSWGGWLPCGTLDVAGLTHIDAAGVKLLAALQHSLSTHGGQLSIVNAAGPVRAQLQDGQIATRLIPTDGRG